MAKKTLTEIREQPGSSNAGDYPNVKEGDFCGPSGGAAEGTYPVNTRKRAKLSFHPCIHCAHTAIACCHHSAAVLHRTSE